MRKLEIIEKYKRYLKKSALTDKDRNLVEDYTIIEKWLEKKCDGTPTDELITLLKMDSTYRTISKASGRGIKFKDIAPFGTWDGMAVKKGTGYITNLKNAYSVGDTDAYNISKGQLLKLMSDLHDVWCEATRLYILQVFMKQDSDMMRIFRKAHRDVEILLQCSAEEDVDEMLESMLQSSEKKPSSPAITEVTIVSSPEVFREIRERAYDAYQEGDTLTVQQCIKDVTALYAKGYFNRQGFTEESAASLYNGCISAFKKYIMRIEGDDERSATNPLDIMKTIIVSSTEPMDGETS